MCEAPALHRSAKSDQIENRQLLYNCGGLRIHLPATLRREIIRARQHGCGTLRTGLAPGAGSSLSEHSAPSPARDPETSTKRQFTGAPTGLRRPTEGIAGHKRSANGPIRRTRSPQVSLPEVLTTRLVWTSLSANGGHRSSTPHPLSSPRHLPDGPEHRRSPAGSSPGTPGRYPQLPHGGSKWNVPPSAATESTGAAESGSAPPWPSSRPAR